MYVSHLLTQAIHDELILTALKRHERFGSFHDQSRHPNQSPLRRHLARTGTCLAILSIVLTLVVLHAPPVGAQQEPETVDSDQDGLTDEQEAGIGSDTNSYDTDGDGVSDGGEVNAGTDPLDTDTDGDGFADKEELDVSTNPLDSSDGPVPSEPSSIALTAYACPAGYEGKALFDDCATPTAGVDFTVSLNASESGLIQTTNDAGQVAFSDLGPGAYAVHEDLADLDNNLERYTASCFGTPAPRHPGARRSRATPGRLHPPRWWGLRDRAHRG